MYRHLPISSTILKTLFIEQLLTTGYAAYVQTKYNSYQRIQHVQIISSTITLKGENNFSNIYAYVHLKHNFCKFKTEMNFSLAQRQQDIP